MKQRHENFLVQDAQHASQWLQTYGECNVSADYDLLYSYGSNNQKLAIVSNSITHEVSAVARRTHKMNDVYTPNKLRTRKIVCERYLYAHNEQVLLDTCLVTIKPTRKLLDVTL